MYSNEEVLEHLEDLHNDPDYNFYRHYSNSDNDYDDSIEDDRDNWESRGW